MKFFKTVCCVFMCITLTSVTAQNQIEQAKTDSIYNWFIQENYAAIHQQFNPEMKRMLSEEILESTWGQLLLFFGNPLETKPKVVQQLDSIIVVKMPIKTEKSAMVLSVSFDSIYQVAGLFLTPGKINYTPPEYVNPEKFEERKITFGGKHFSGTGILTLPKVKYKVPVVVIVPGSGPVDKDLTIGSNKIYKDLAWGLASFGFAALRYDKRTLNYQDKLLQQDINGEKFTIQNEYIADLKDIIDQLKKRTEINSKQIVMLGHSQGGYLIPLIHQKVKGFSGYISLAGTLREIPELAMEQINYLSSLDSSQADTNTIAPILKRMLQSTSKYVNQMKYDNEVMPPYTLNYWQYLAKYQPQKQVLKIKQPILILQGERDYQVTLKDYQVWKDCIGLKQNATFQSFPQLNHLFMAGEGKPNPNEYLQPGNVAIDVVNAMVNWLKTTQIVTP